MATQEEQPVAPDREPIIPVEPWKPVTPGRWGYPDRRSAMRLVEILAQFDVTKHPRYQRRDVSGDSVPETFCNIFVTDATVALQAPIPHYVDGLELSANRVYDWLSLHGPANGWHEVTELEAREAAKAGKPAVVAWKNPKGSGHIAILTPSFANETRIAQAGKVCYFDVPLTRGFGSATPLRYWAHE